MQNFSLLNWIIVLVPLMLVGGAIFLFGRAIGGRKPRERSVGKRPAAERPASARSDAVPGSSTAAAPVVATKTEPADGPSGFKGWLVPVAIGVILEPVVTIIKFMREADFGDATGKYQLLFIKDIVLYAVLFILHICTAYFMLRRSRQFAPFYIAASIGMILLLPSQILLTGLLAAFAAGAPIGPVVRATIGAVPSHDVDRWIATSAGLVIWIIYVMRSRRVANTFIR